VRKVWCSVLQCGAVWCSMLQCGAVCCSVVQCAAVWCSVLQGVGGIGKNHHGSVVQCGAGRWGDSQ